MRKDKEAHAAYMREYRARPEAKAKKNEADREYAAAHREEALERATKYYRSNTIKVKAYAANRRKEQKAKYAAILGGVCERCGFNHLAALDFHHKDPTQKLFRLSDAIVRTKKYTPEEIFTEVLKCELLCKNCHAIEHCTWVDNA